MPVNWTRLEHFSDRMAQRGISEETLQTVLTTPDSIRPGKHNRTIYQRVIGDRLVMVIAKENVLISVIATSKIKKYTEGI